MKKSLLYLLFALMISITPNAYCEESDINSQIQATTMPTDEEIMETIKKFNFDKNQQDYLFKETKKRLEEMYSNKNFSSVIDGTSTLIDDTPETKEKAIKTKKYSSHGSLTRRSN